MEKKSDDIGAMNIFQRLAAITAEIGTIEKTLLVESGKKSYKAVSESSVLDAVKPLEEKYRVYSYPVNRTRSTQVVEREYTYEGQPRKVNVIVERIEVTYRFLNIDNPEEFADTVAYGTGMDTGDKASGKGMTYADKYALMKMYKISTGDNNDPDSSPSPDEGLLFGSYPDPTNPMMYVSDTPQNGPEGLTPGAAESKPDPAAVPSQLNGVPIPTTVEEAKAVILEIGTLAGKTFGEVLALKPSQIEFYASDKFNNVKYPQYKAAAKLLLGERNR